MRAVVIGAAGFIGRHLVEQLLASDIEVYAVVRNIERIPRAWRSKNNVHVICEDLKNLCLSDRMKALPDNVDLCFCLAWEGSSGDARANVKLQLDNVLHICQMSEHLAVTGCRRFINAGSLMEYEVVQLFQKEEKKPGKGTIYSMAKLAADYMARITTSAVGMEYINVIISNAYGQGDYSRRFFNTTLAKMIADEPVPLSPGEQLYDFIYISDAARYIAEAGIHGRDGENYYIGNCSQRPLRDYVIEMKDTIKSKSKLQFGAVPFSGISLSYTEFDTGKINQEFGLTPEVSFTEGVLRTKAWLEKSRTEENNHVGR